MVLVLVLTACSASETSLLDARLEGGGRLRDFVPSSEPTVVLLFSPSDCFTCGSAIGGWATWGAQHPEHFRVFFSRRPTDAERRELARYRIVETAVVNTTVTGTPLELLVINGTPVHTAPLSDSSLYFGLLSHALGRPVKDLVTFPTTRPEVRVIPRYDPR